jgi:hypothetical protein
VKTDNKETLQQLTELYDSTPGYVVRHNNPMQVRLSHDAAIQILKSNLNKNAI